MSQVLPFPPRVVLPSPSPVEETVRWQGRPTWWGAATRIWHVRAVGFYFAVLLADGLRDSLAQTAAGALARQGETALLLIGVGAVALLLLLAWLTARTTTYTITETHLMMRYGIGLRSILVIPFGAIVDVAVRIHGDHTGDVALRLRPGQRVLFPKLWPHVRPWTFLKAEPMLRGVPQAGSVAALLTRGIVARVEIRDRLEQDLAARGVSAAPEADDEAVA